MTTWHAEPELLERYADGRTDDVLAASLEAHLLACAQCRGRVAAYVPASRLRGNWDAVVATLDAPTPGPLERLLVRSGLRASTARLLTATPTLRLSWLSSIALALAFAAVAATRPGGAPLLFLALAPLVPVVAVAIAFNPSLDPSSEMVEATPVAGLRLLFLRTLASLGPSIVLAGVAGRLVADPGDSLALWLLPALALSALSLALASVVPIATAASALGVLWASGVVVAEAAARGSLAAVASGGEVESVLVHLPAQLLAGAVALFAAVVATRHSLQPGQPNRRHA